MAARYWVGGTGTWSSTNTTNWATTSGGAGGASVPTSADNIVFDSLSGTGTCTFTNSAVTVGGISLNTVNITLLLGAALTSSASLIIAAGTFTTSNYNVTAQALSSNGTTARTINLGSSTVTLNFTTAINFATPTNLVFNAGTSTINLSTATFSGGGQTFYNVANNNAGNSISFGGANTFNNLTLLGRTTLGINTHSFSSNQTINGTFTVSAGTDATMRTFVRSATLGTTITLTCAAAAATDTDFRDITIAGAAAPVSGTRLGDCKGNSGITFDAAKTVYWSLGILGGNWSSTAWATSIGGVAAVNNFPLAQDTAIVPSTSPLTGKSITIDFSYNIGTIDTSARTSNTLTLTCNGDYQVHGNFINGTGTSLTASTIVTFCGRNTQNITTAGKNFSGNITVNSPSGSVTLQDALSITGNITLTQGTFSAGIYNVTMSASGIVSLSNSNVRTLNTGSGTWTLAGSGTVWDANTSTNLTLTGTSTISCTTTALKTFAGGSLSYLGITVNQGGTGTLTISGSNKFANLTNTAIGRIQFTGGTTNEFTSFSINGAAGTLLPLGSSTTTQAILKKPTAWNVGANSTNAGNNTGLSFTAGGNDYLTVSYINGQISASGNYTVVANNGTYTVAGQSASLLRSKVLSANNGTYAVTGQSASLLRSKVLSANNGVYTVTGQTATLLRSRLVTSNTGYYNVVGYPATIVIGGTPIIVTDQLLIKLRSFTERRRF